MKFTKTLAILLPILVGIPALSGCNSNEHNNPDKPVNPDVPEVVKPIEIETFFEKINTDKNYTYTYEFFERKNEESEFKTTFKYVDKFTDYGMYSKALVETSKKHTNLAWASDEKQGTYQLFIDENGDTTPGRAIRDGNRENIKNYYNQVVALDDLKFEDLGAKLYKKKYNYKITNVGAKGTIIEASQLNADRAKETAMEIILNLEDEKNVTIHGDLGKNTYFTGSITDVGTTEIPEVKSYIESGKGPFIQTEVDTKLQSVIDTFNTFNYATPLYGEIIGDNRPLVGTTKVYKKVLNDKTAIVKFNDYDEASKVDDGLIEIQTPSEHATYNFTIVDGKIKLGTQAIVKDKPMVSFMDDYCFELPNSLSALNEDAIIFDYDTVNKMFVTYDTYITVETCIFFDLVYSLEFTAPLCTVINPIYEEGKTGLQSVELRYYWEDQNGNQPYTSTFYTDFGSANLPFVDEFLEAR